MGKPAVALIVAGAGETDPKEVYDLLEDAFDPEDYDEIGVVFPVDKELFTDSVENVIEWLDAPDGLYPVRTKDAPMSRRSSEYNGATVAESFESVFDPREWEDWDEVQFLVALPEEDDEVEYDRAVGWVEKALDNGIKVKNLTRGLDDVTIADEEPAPEPEPEPEEKPTRRRRSRKSEPKDEEPDEAEEASTLPEDPPGDSAVEQAEVARATVALQDERQDVLDDLDAVRDVTIYEALGDVVEAVLRLRDLFAPELSAEDSAKVEKATAEPEEDQPKRGRGRPRTNFEVKQVWDEDEEEWVARPKGRLRKGTKFRTIHADTEEVLDEGVQK